MTQIDSLAAFGRALQRRVLLSDHDLAAIGALSFTVRELEPHSYLVREGERTTVCAVLLQGYAYRQKVTGEGARQILSINIPGDALDLQNIFLTCSDHNVQALTRVRIAAIPRDPLIALIRQNPTIAHGVLLLTLVEAAIFREWIVNVGRRDARTRIAHLLCEFAMRLDDAGLAIGGQFELPITQEQLGDATGLTAVHVNRSLRGLEGDGLIRRAGRSVSIPSVDALRRAGDFSSLYLHRSN